jgi:hypothetical protein
MQRYRVLQQVFCCVCLPISISNEVKLATNTASLQPSALEVSPRRGNAGHEGPVPATSRRPASHEQERADVSIRQFLFE